MHACYSFCFASNLPALVLELQSIVCMTAQEVYTGRGIKSGVEQYIHTVHMYVAFYCNSRLQHMYMYS